MIEALEAKIKILQQPAEWVMKTGSGDVTSKTIYKLCNTQSDECLGWQKHKSGLNISWFGQSADKQARLVKKDGGPIKYGDTIALFVGQTSDSYLCYTKRTFGINLDWSTKPCYQWRIDSPAAGNKTACSKNDLIVTNASLYAKLVKELAALESKLKIGLRIEGLDLLIGPTCTMTEDELRGRGGLFDEEAVRATVRRLEELGYVRCSNDQIRLTETGRYM